MSDHAQKQLLPLNKSYIGSRPDILRLIPSGTTRMLDLGCSVGQMGLEAKRLYPELHVTGVELDGGMADLARDNLDHVIVSDLNTFDFLRHFPAEEFDCIIMADILEHTIDPWAILDGATKVLSPKGVVITSIPNVRHYSTLISLAIKGEWPYRDRGIHDRTHLRFFTRSTILELISRAGLRILQESRNMRIVERGSRMDKIANLLALPVVRELVTFQYLHVSALLQGTTSVSDTEHGILQ